MVGGVRNVSQGQQEGGQALWRAGHRVYLGLPTHCQTADISLSVGALGVTSCLSGCVGTYVFEWAGGQTVMHFTPPGFVPASSVWSPNQAELAHARTRPHNHVKRAPLSFTFAVLTHCRIPSKFVHKDDTLLLSPKRARSSLESTLAVAWE